MGFCLLAGLAKAEEPVNMGGSLFRLESQRLESLVKGKQPLVNLTAQYRAALESRKASAQQSGDLDAASATEEELTKLSRGDNRPDLPKDPQINRLKKTYLEQMAKLETQVTSKLVEVEKNHATGLADLAALLAKAGNLDEAKQITDRREEFIRDFTQRRPQLAKADLQSPGEVRGFPIAEGVTADFCWIPPGTFNMGSPESEIARKPDETPHPVAITRGFWMARTEWTQAQWAAVTGKRPSFHKGDNLPVEQVSWIDICANESRGGGFLAKINERAPAGWKFDLPTEAEWEYACRAGTTGSLGNGTSVTTGAGVCANLDKVGWYDKTSGGHTHPVAGKAPNKWGLHDMHGNVWEWCADWKGPYSSGPAVDPQGPPGGKERVLRSGSWRHPAQAARSANRTPFRADIRYVTVGFRPILRPTGLSSEPLIASKSPDNPPKPAADTGIPAKKTTVAPSAPTVSTAGFDDPVPQRTGPPADVEVTVVSENDEKHEFIYTSRHFEFICDRRMTDRLVAGFGKLYEATYDMVRAMPWGATIDSETANGLFKVRIFTQEKDYLKAGGMEGSAGTAIGTLSLVQMDALGVKDTGTRLILEDIEANHVVVHELVHALRDKADEELPVWAVEGFAEYAASAPYERSGRFSFHNRIKDVANCLRETRAMDDDSVAILGLESLLSAGRAEFYGDEHGAIAESASRNYAGVLLIMNFFWHEDRGKSGDQPVGSPMRAWLKAINEGKSEKEARGLLLNGRTYSELEAAIIKTYRSEFKVTFDKTAI